MDLERRAERQRRIEAGTYPCHSRYENKHKRVKSFVEYDWSPQTNQTILQLAEAGFFYTGYGDATICFQCGCGLKRWLKNDDPFIEHARYSPHCHYLKLIKGEVFIRDARRLLPTPPNATQEILQMMKNIRRPPPSPPVVEKEILEGKECLICLAAERQIAFQPCGHLTTCIQCSFKINICCICRIEIKSRMRIIAS